MVLRPFFLDLFPCSPYPIGSFLPTAYCLLLTAYSKVDTNALPKGGANFHHRSRGAYVGFRDPIAEGRAEAPSRARRGALHCRRHPGREVRGPARSGPAGRHVGLLAQEVQAEFPELVREDAEGNLSVAYGNFTAVLLVAIQEQQQEIELQRRELSALRERLEALESDRSAQR